MNDDYVIKRLKKDFPNNILELKILLNKKFKFK